jgi:hypothetical protein
MKYAIRSCSTLLLLTASIAFLPSTSSSAASGVTKMSGDPTTEASLQKMEMELAQGDVSRDPAPFTKYLDDGIIALGPGWSDHSKAEVLKDIQSGPCKITNPTLSGFTYKWLTPDVVLVSYMLNQTATCNGKTMPGGHQQANSLWQKKSGKWLVVFHQATADVPTASDSGK